MKLPWHLRRAPKPVAGARLSSQAMQASHHMIMRDVEVIVASGARFPFLTSRAAKYVSKKRILQLLRRRFKPYASPQKLRRYALSMIDEAYDNFWTRTYAKFQARTAAILQAPGLAQGAT